VSVPKPRILGALLSVEEKKLLSDHLGGASGGIEGIAKLLSKKMGKGDKLPVELTFTFHHDAGGQAQGATAARVRISGFARACYDDGTCGCVEDPPGISYSC
jgi:hypothetical protein